VHEYAHAQSAVSAGDDTPRLDGRLTIFPWDHFEIWGALMCIMTSITGMGIGWGKPVRINPVNLRHPRWDGVRIAAWGPFSNLLLALGFALLLRIPALASDEQLAPLLGTCVLANLGLLVFNLIPIHPLDGSKVLAGFLPDELAYRYGRFMTQWGFTLLLGLVLLGNRTGLLDALVGHPVRIMAIWLGVPLE
jgi:Zn-dependent protease